MATTHDGEPALVRQLQRLCDLGLIAESEEVKERKRAQAAADAFAMAYLAEQGCPEDLKTWGLNNKIPAFAEMTWQAGYVAGFRAAIAGISKYAPRKG